MSSILHNPTTTCTRARGSRAFFLVTCTSTGKARYTTANNVRLPQQTDLLDVYRGLVAMGRIGYDEDQVRVVMKLRRLSRALRDYAPPAFASQYYHGSSSVETSGSQEGSGEPWYSSSKSASSAEIKYYEDIKSLVRIRSQAEALAELRTPKGLMLTGPPGCGKSFLVDLWFSTLPTPFKTRKHYSELVLEIYRGVWEETRRRRALMFSHAHEGQGHHGPTSSRPAWTSAVRTHWRRLVGSGALPKSWKSTAYRDAITSTSRTHLALPPISFSIAHRLVTQHWLLAFDELQLLDVSSAGLLADVLSWFWRMGGIVVTSSNKVPDDLYRGGVQRERLEPFVEALKIRCPVLEMRGRGDWRREKASQGLTSFWFTNDRKSEFWNCVTQLTSGSPSTKRRELSIFGRRLVVPHSAGDTCRFTFSELCDESLGPADYISIAAHYRTVVITSIPILRVSAKNQSRRFISLIDALYEARCRVIALAEAEPDELFFPDTVLTSRSKEIHDDAMTDDQLMAEAISESREVLRPNISSYAEEPERPSATPLSLDTLSIFSGEEERFAYKRALSRLIEMTSDRYAENDRWNPLTSNRRRWESFLSDPTQSRRQSVESESTSHVSRDEAHVGSYAAAVDFHDDFAAEASGEGEARLQRAVRERPNAPRLAKDHIWGVREDWGEKAGMWGKGAAAFGDGPSKDNGEANGAKKEE